LPVAVNRFITCKQDVRYLAVNFSSNYTPLLRRRDAYSFVIRIIFVYL
jgi:hypothetical protein